MNVKNCLKISYCGLVRYVICDSRSRYDDIVKQVIKLFDIPEKYEKSLLIANDHGYIFDKNVFEYFILLFPNPEIIFYVRVDYTEISNRNSTEQIDSNSLPIPFGSSKMNKRSRCDNDEGKGETREYRAAPVRRQNCFIGELPTPGAVRRHNASLNIEDFTRQAAKRIRLMDSRQKKRRSLTKRSFRI